MSEPILVAPFAEALLDRLAGRPLVLRLQSERELAAAVRAAQNRGLDLRCMVVPSRLPLSEQCFGGEWRACPVALEVPGTGRFRDLIRRLGPLRELDIRIYLPADRPERFAELRILSSLGISSAALLDGRTVDWERLNDLAAYSFFSLVRHAPIEPFDYLARNYQASKRTGFGAVYFDDPDRYLHLDAGGKVYRTAADLAGGKPCAEDLTEFDADPARTAGGGESGRWQDHFLRAEGCSVCGGWRACLGRFAEEAGTNGAGCSPFFTELVDSIEQRQSMEKPERSVWQP